MPKWHFRMVNRILTFCRVWTWWSGVLWVLPCSSSLCATRQMGNKRKRRGERIRVVKGTWDRFLLSLTERTEVVKTSIIYPSHVDTWQAWALSFRIHNTSCCIHVEQQRAALIMFHLVFMLSRLHSSFFYISISPRQVRAPLWSTGCISRTSTTCPTVQLPEPLLPLQ